MQTAINSAGCCNKPAGQCNPNLHPSKLWLIVTFATGSSRPKTVVQLMELIKIIHLVSV